MGPSPATFKIVVRPMARLFALFKSLLSGSAALAGIGAIAEGVEGLINTPGTDTTIDIVKIVLGVPIIPIGSWIFISTLAIATARNARLELFDDHLLIHHRGIFRKPVKIDRTDIAATTFDIRHARLRRFRDHPRFELTDIGDEPLPGWLYSKVGGSPFPLLSQIGDVPNLAIGFKQPLKLGPARRGIKVFPAKATLHPPIHGRQSRGLLLRLKDAERAAKAFETRWESVRPIEWRDLEPLRPSAWDERKVRIISRVDDGAIVVIMSSAALVSLFVEAPFQNATLGPGTGVCDQAAQELDEDPPADVDVDSPSLLDSFMPTELESEGFFLLAGGSFEPEGGDQFQQIVNDNDPERAFSSRWANGTEDLFVDIYEMDDRAGANQLAGDLVGAICVDANETFDVGQDGGVGMRWQGSEGIVDLVVLERDEFVTWIVVVERSNTNSVETAVEATELVATKMS